jgi:hypothetical protein
MRNKPIFLIIGTVAVGIIVTAWMASTNNISNKHSNANIAAVNTNAGFINSAPTTTADIFLIAVDDNGQTGTKIGCGDSLVPVNDMVTIPGTATDQQVADSITAALTKLFSMHDMNYGQSGLYNALYRSNLMVDRVTYTSAATRVALSGTLELGGECDNPRVEAEITQAIVQFTPGVVPTITLNGQILANALSLK